MKEIKKIHEKVEVALRKSQKEIKNFTPQMMKILMKKLTEKYIRPYRVKKIILENVVELKLPVSLRIHLVVNVSRIVLYKGQIERQKKIPPLPVEIEGEKEYKIEKILDRQDVRGKLKYLVRWKEYTAEEDTWKRLENLENTMKLVKEFEQEIRAEEIRQVERRKEKGKESELNPEAEVFRRSKLLEKYIAKILFGWDNGKFKDEYLKKLKRSWAR